MTYACSCGSSYNESIPCTSHNWKERYGTIEHASQGEMRQVLVNEGSGDVYICNYCGAEFGSSSANVDHCASYVGTDRAHATATYTIRGGQPVYEEQWIETSPAWTETIVIGCDCTVCGVGSTAPQTVDKVPEKTGIFFVPRTGEKRNPLCDSVSGHNADTRNWHLRQSMWRESKTER